MRCAALAVEFAVRYDAMDALCPSQPRYDAFLLELSVCQVLDKESTFCEVTHITSMSTIRDAQHQQSAQTQRRRRRRRLFANDAGFDIYIAMALSARDASDLSLVSDFVSLYAQFVADVLERWRNNGEAQGVAVGNILSVASENDLPTLAPSAPPIQIVTVRSPTANPSSSADADLNVTDSSFELAAVDEGMFDVGESIAIVVGSPAFLGFCFIFVCCYMLESNKRAHREAMPMQMQAQKGSYRSRRRKSTKSSFCASSF